MENISFETLISQIKNTVIDSELALKLLNSAQEKIELEESISEKLKNSFHHFLDISRKSEFLLALETNENRILWSEVVFKIIQKTNFSFEMLFAQRRNEHASRVLFQDMSTGRPLRHTYNQVYLFMREIAAFFYKEKEDNPRVAIFSLNSVSSAVTDLACLSYDIFDTPLNIHFNDKTLIHIIDKLEIDFIVTDTVERLSKLIAIRKNTIKEFKIVYTNTDIDGSSKPDYFLYQECKNITRTKVTEILSRRKLRPVNMTATTMFTSGSTGLPKGVSFSIYNLVSKRFARAAALPKVGNNESMLSFLPLFHTFGRYLEMMGTIFWGGTYIFSGNQSSATLMDLFPKVNPSIFISVPIRWVQLYDKCIKQIAGSQDEEKKQKVVRAVVGKKLHFGLSAAGYLDPKIFRFFQRYGVELCSGFGMTEASGGITMTPPGDYSENSTGLPLPGIRTRLKDNGELELWGHYLAKYLEEAGPDEIIPFPEEENYWLPTGDIFQIHKSGHHEIIDRVKDIYKNNKGQTVAPGMIENKFTGVPGIKRTFLVGDARAYNVLLISPENSDPIIQATENEQEITEYFHQIITSANKDLAPYERIVNFKVIDQEFSEEKGELTAKGSFKRKNIEENYSEIINLLYKRNHIYFEAPDFKVSIPRWFVRDLGILETDISFENGYLYNRVSKAKLRLEKSGENNKFLIGNFIYDISDSYIDIGRIIRQPKLWVGNIELIRFSPCKESFDLPVKNISELISMPEQSTIYTPADFPHLIGVRNSNLIFINSLISTAIHTERKTAIPALLQLGKIFNDYERNLIMIIRRRLEALACHSDEQIRIEAFRILLTEDPDPNFSEAAPAFIRSGKSFLNEESINSIAASNFSQSRLDSLRRRMNAYRKTLSWPANEKTRKQFDTVFKLLLSFCNNNPLYFGSVRAEFSSWEMLKQEPYLSKKAQKYFHEAFTNFDKYIEETTPFYNREDWLSRVIFDDGIKKQTQQTIIDKLDGNQFLKQSLILAFDEKDFDLMQVPEGGIWISRIRSYRSSKHYRMSINTMEGKHFDLHISLDAEINTEKGQNSVKRYIAMDGHPHGQPVFPTFGCNSRKHGIISTKYVSELAAWEKIRALSEVQVAGSVFHQPNVWRKLYIKSMTAFYRGWDIGGRDIFPGFVSPNNVVVPETDFSDGAKIISLSGYSKMTRACELSTAMLHNFYYKTISHYPQVKKFLNKSWLFHACIEAFGEKEGEEILKQQKAELEQYAKMNHSQKDLYQALCTYLEGMKDDSYLPLALFNAIDRYADWRRKNSFAGAEAIEQTISELFELYELNQYPDIVRYTFYRETYFTEAVEEIRVAFDSLLAKMQEDLTQLPIHMTELSDMQMVLHADIERSIFANMVFPKNRGEKIVDILKVGKKEDKKVVVQTAIHDKNNVKYTMREPIEPSEVGALYKLFYNENYPKKISKMDKHYIVTNSHKEVVGGLCYKMLDGEIALLDGTAVTSPLHGKGIGSAMIEDFFSRMGAQGVKMVKAHFLFGNYYLKHNFKVDKKWGALIREL